MIKFRGLGKIKNEGNEINQEFGGKIPEGGTRLGNSAFMERAFHGKQGEGKNKVENPDEPQTPEGSGKLG